MNRIKSISYLDKGDKRQRLLVDERTGYFSLFYDKAHPGEKYKGYPTYGLSAAVLIEAVRHGDPVLELVSGERVRVCQGGDGDAIRVDALCICESHDKYYRNRSRGA